MKVCWCQVDFLDLVISEVCSFLQLLRIASQDLDFAPAILVPGLSWSGLKVTAVEDHQLISNSQSSATHNATVLDLTLASFHQRSSPRHTWLESDNGHFEYRLGL